MGRYRVAVLLAVVLVVAVASLDASKKTAHKAKARPLPHKAKAAEQHKRAAVRPSKTKHHAIHAKSKALHNLETEDRKLSHLEMDLENGLADVKYVETMVHNTEEKLNSALKDVQSLMQEKVVSLEAAPVAEAVEEAPMAEPEPEPVSKADEVADAADNDDIKDLVPDAPAAESADANEAPAVEDETADAPAALDEPTSDSVEAPAADADSVNSDASAEPEPEALDVALEGEEDLEVVALLQQDDMNDGTGEEMLMAPRSRPLRLMQQDSPSKRTVETSNANEDNPPTAERKDKRDMAFGPFAANLEGGTADVTEDGQVIPKKPYGRENQLDRGVDATGDRKPDANTADPNDPDSEIIKAKTGLAVPGGDSPTPPSENNTSPNDVVCMCKRQGAPKKMKGYDRVKCKRHPSPTPTPEAPVEGIRQCVTGTWAGVTGSTPDANTTDTICIYFPARLPTPPEAAPEREWPDECYDDRNEFVAEGVVKRPWDQFLIQEGFEAHHFEPCGCGS